MILNMDLHLCVSHQTMDICNELHTQLHIPIVNCYPLLTQADTRIHTKSVGIVQSSVSYK